MNGLKTRLLQILFTRNKQLKNIVSVRYWFKIYLMERVTYLCKQIKFSI